MTIDLKGCIALCGKGALGLITQSEPMPIVYADHTTANAYVGIHLTDKIAPVGSPWSSRAPVIIAHVDALLPEPVENPDSEPAANVGTTDFQFGHNLDALIERARALPPATPEQEEEQRRSFAYGNVSLHNPNITREMVDKVADEMASKKGTCHSCGKPTHKLGGNFGWIHDTAYDFQRCGKQGIPAEELNAGQMDKMVHWDEPFGPNSEPVYMSVPVSTAVAVIKEMVRKKFKGTKEISDQQALDEFVAVHWAEVK